MGKDKSDGKKKKKKSSQLVLRVEQAERDAFVKLCEGMDTSAAREIRRFMREWVAKHTQIDAVALPVEAAPDDVPAPPNAESEPVADAAPKPARRKRKDAAEPA